LKNKIFLAKRQLEHVYDNRGIQGKEDELKALQKELQALQDEKDALIRVKREQTKALKLIRNDTEYEPKIINLKTQLSKLKEECKQLSEKLVENERILRKLHEQFITRQGKIKEMEAKIKEAKEKAKKPVVSTVTVEMISKVEEEINQLEKERKETEKNWNEKISNVELQARRVEHEKKVLILKDKEKELRLNELRIKELKKLLAHQQSEAKKIEEPKDPKEFKNRRNIKFLEKDNDKQKNHPQ
jgi:hypothetical protein